MKSRKAVFDDLNEILKIYETAREYMRRSGNPNQWGNTNPPKETLEKDIELGQLYVVYDETGSESSLLGCFACIGGADPTYTVIEGGHWLNNEPYVTLHRTASSGKIKGIMDFIIADTSKKSANIRVDTHEDNKTMQHILYKNGFTHCGTIYLANGNPRLAFHRCTDAAADPE